MNNKTSTAKYTLHISSTIKKDCMRERYIAYYQKYFTFESNIYIKIIDVYSISNKYSKCSRCTEIHTWSNETLPFVSISYNTQYKTRPYSSNHFYCSFSYAFLSIRYIYLVCIGTK